MKKAIVTGATGFVGKYLVNELVENGYDVWAIARSKQSDVSTFKDDRIHVVYCDLTNISKLPLIINEREFDLFYQLAWDGHYGQKREEYALQLNNAKSFADAANVCCEMKCKRFLGAGSVTELMYRDFLKNDGATPEMVTCYAIGKITAEYLCRCVCNQNGTDYIWPYISNFYGIGDRTQNFINFLISNYQNGTTPDLTSGEQLADFMYVTDVARALVRLGEAGTNNETYYVGYGNPRPLKYFIELTRNIINPEIETGLGRKQFHGLSIDYDEIDYLKLVRDTGFKPEVDFEEGICRTAEWIKTNKL